MATFLVVTQTRIERGMDEVKEVPGLTEADLQAAVIDQITAICDPLLPMKEGEVTVNDVAKSWQRPAASTRAALDLAVAEGHLAKRKALNPKTGRECWAYRVVT